MIVVVSGLPGSGKSFFAEKLAARLGASYINSDRIRKTLTPTQYSIDDKMLVYKEMLKQVEVLVNQKRNVVVDGTFYKNAIRLMFLNLAKIKNTNLFFINISADEALIIERLKKPRSFSDADAAVYYKIKDSFEPYNTPHLELHSTNDNLTTLINKAIQYLRDERK